MGRAAVFMAGGTREGFGLSAAEAMMSGCYVVGYHGHGGAEFFHDNFCLTVPDGDYLHYLSAMQKVLAKDIGELAKLGEVARRFIQTTYSLDREKKSILEAWRRIMEQ